MWAISPEERGKHDQKFDTLSPSMGYITGMHVKNTRSTMTLLITLMSKGVAFAFVLMDYIQVAMTNKRVSILGV